MDKEQTGRCEEETSEKYDLFLRKNCKTIQVECDHRRGGDSQGLSEINSSSRL